MSYRTVVLKKEEEKISSGPTEMDFPATFEEGGGGGLVSPLLGQSLKLLATVNIFVGVLDIQAWYCVQMLNTLVVLKTVYCNEN